MILLRHSFPLLSLLFLLSFLSLPHLTNCNIVIACRCSDGVIIGTDSLSVSGALVGNRVSECVFSLGESTVICCASGQSDFQHLVSDLRAFIRSCNGDVKTSSIARFARRLVNQKYRNTHLIIAGSDGRDKNTGNGRNTDGNHPTGGNDSGDSIGSTSVLDIGVGGTNSAVEVGTSYNSSGNNVSPAGHDNTGSDIDCDSAKSAANILIASHVNNDDLSHSDDVSSGVDNGGTYDDMYSVHEILSGGTLISQDYALAGSGSDCVVTLMDDLFPSDIVTSSSNGRGIFPSSILPSRDHLGGGGIEGVEGVGSGGVGVASKASPLPPTSSQRVAPSLPTVEASAGRVRRVLRASKTFDPRTGAELRVWSFTKQGLKLI